jgi:hypothetical protein
MDTSPTSKKNRKILRLVCAPAVSFHRRSTHTENRMDTSKLILDTIEVVSQQIRQLEHDRDRYLTALETIARELREIDAPQQIEER